MPSPRHIFYLTVNEPPTLPVYQSQVVAAIRFWQKEMNMPIKLIALLPVRPSFLHHRHKLLSNLPDSIVLPSPAPARWFDRSIPLATALLKKIIPQGSLVVARGWAVSAILPLTKTGYAELVWDPRSPLSVEVEEFPDAYPPAMQRIAQTLEKEALHHSRAVIAITQEMAQLMEERSQTKAKEWIIVPNVMSDAFEQFEPAEKESQRLRHTLSIPLDAVVVAYAGSLAPWHDPQHIARTIDAILTQHNNTRVLLLTNPTHPTISALKNKWNQRITTMQVPHEEVPRWLWLADWGLLINRTSLLTSIAFPVRVAEYLASGLQVLVEGLPIVEKFIINHRAGTPLPKKLHIRTLALTHLSRKNFTQAYAKIFGTK